MILLQIMAIYDNFILVVSYNLYDSQYEGGGSACFAGKSDLINWPLCPLGGIINLINTCHLVTIKASLPSHVFSAKHAEKTSSFFQDTPFRHRLLTIEKAPTRCLVRFTIDIFPATESAKPATKNRFTIWLILYCKLFIYCLTLTIMFFYTPFEKKIIHMLIKK